MTLLFVMNLGFAWGANTAAPATTSHSVASPKSAGSLKARG